MSAVELANAYISILPSMAGAEGKLRRELAQELGGLDTIASREGDKAGKAFGSSMADKAKDIAAGAGAAASLALGAGFANSLSIEKGTDKLAGQLGLTAEDSIRAGTLAGDLYKSNFGDSLGQVNEAIAVVSKNISGLATTNSADMERLTSKAIGLADAFDQDLGMSTAAVGQMLKTGLARNADEAFDIITVGFQKGVDKGGDFLETLNEYGTQFRKLGIDGKTATGLLSQGIQAGARDSDVVADTFLEFADRATSGTKEVAAGFGLIGLNAEQMRATIAAGGPAAAAALDTTLDRLRAIEDPVKRNDAAMALFGERAIDLGAALFALDPSEAAAGLGEVTGATDKLNATIGNNTAGKIESVKRQFELWTSSIGGAVGPLGAILPAAGGLVTTFGAMDGVVGKIASGIGSTVGKAADLAKGLGSAAASGAQFAATQATAAVNVARTTGALVAQKVAATAQAVATKAVAVAQGIFNAVMALNPIFLIVLAVVAFIAILVLAYTKVEFFRNFVDAAFRLVLGVVQSVVGWVRDNWPLLLAILTGPIGLAVLAITKNWGTIKAGFTAVKDWIFEKVGNIVGFITSIPGRVAGGLSSLWRLFTDGVAMARNWVVDRLNDVVGFVSGLPGRIGNAARGMWDSLSGGFRAALNFIIRGWNNLEFRIPGFSIGPVSFGGFVLGLPDIPSFDGGGVVPGALGQPVLAVVHGGEEVLTADQRGRGGQGFPQMPITVNAAPGLDEHLVAGIAARRIGWALRTAPG